MASSCPLSMKLRMLAATFTPPIEDDFRFWLPANCLAITSFSSLSACGGMPSRVAMRISTSARVRSGRNFSASAPWSGSRCDSTMAMICGCSLRTRTAMARGSIHFRVSRPVVLRPSRMRSIRLLARSSPSACTSTLRTYSSAPLPMLGCSRVSTNSSITFSTSWRDTPPTEVMATPSFCTSFAPMCLSTSAACCSPSDSRITAARWTPVSA